MSTLDTNAITIRGLRKVYADATPALNGIDLDVQPGDFFALLGPNGAGKSTTIGVLSSLVRKTSGKVSVFGHDIDTHFSLAKQRLGIVPQEVNFNLFETGLDIVLNQAGYYGLGRRQASRNAERYLRQLGLWEKRKTPSRMLSGGMKRRLMVARALVHEPDVLILDEPSAGVDIELRRSMWSFLKEINEQGKTIILTTHYLEEAEQLCRHVAIINKGEIIENTSVKSLLKKLNREVFVLDLREDLASIPVVDGYQLIRRDARTLEADVEKGQSLNVLFSGLSELGIEVISMRNKVNRLEELFVSLVTHHDANVSGTGRSGRQ